MRLVGENLVHAFAERPVLDGVNLEVGEGECVAIVGPSGMGKTTLMALLGGLIDPGSGRVGVATGQGEELHPPARWVSWVLQTTNVLPDRSVRDNVRLGCFADGATRGESAEQAMYALDQVGLADRSAEPVRVLSGGETQRVVIARALASRRPFLLADEPTGHLDSATSLKVMEALLLAGRRRALVLVTHDTDLAKRCDRVLRLTEGRLRDQSTGMGL